MTHLLIVRPGAGYSPHNNQGAFDECARSEIQGRISIVTRVSM